MLKIKKVKVSANGDNLKMWQKKKINKELK